MNIKPYTFDGSGDITQLNIYVHGIVSLDGREITQQIDNPNVGTAWFQIEVSGIKAKQAKVIIDEPTGRWRWSKSRWVRHILTDGIVFHNLCGIHYNYYHPRVARYKTRANKMNLEHRKLIQRKIQEYLNKCLGN